MGVGFRGGHGQFSCLDHQGKGLRSGASGILRAVSSRCYGRFSKLRSPTGITKKTRVPKIPWFRENHPYRDTWSSKVRKPKLAELHNAVRIRVPDSGTVATLNPKP